MYLNLRSYYRLLALTVMLVLLIAMLIPVSLDAAPAANVSVLAQSSTVEVGTEISNNDVIACEEACEATRFLPLITRNVPVSSIFSLDADVLALLELDRDTLDISGNDRHATLLGGEFVATDLGRGLRVGASDPSDPVGIDWSSYASLLVHPYTVEMILTPEETTSYRKLFSADDSQDGGWYYRGEGIQAYPNPRLGTGQAKANELHYIAFVSTASDQIDIYFQGERIGSTDASFTAPPSAAVFFRDDSATARGEQLTGVVESLRISKVSRTAAEIKAVQESIEQAVSR